MKVILEKDLENLGEEGEIKVVKDGYARNFLIPRGYAVAYNKHSVDILSQKKASIDKRKEEKRKEAMGLKEKLEALTVTLVMPAGENGKLFGAVNNATVVEELAKQGINITRRVVEIPGNSIKTVGSFTAKIKLYDKESASLTIEVKAAEENAE